MNAQEFCYWLQGPAELNPEWVPSPEQWQSIKDHLQTVFVKVTPAYQAPSLGFPGMRTLELRPSDIAWPGGVAPAITC